MLYTKFKENYIQIRWGFLQFFWQLYFQIYTYNTSFLFPAIWWSRLHCIYLMNLSFLTCYSDCVTWNLWSLSLASPFSQYHFSAIISFGYFLSFNFHVCNGVTWKWRCGFFWAALRCHTFRWCWCFAFCTCWLRLSPLIVFCLLFPREQQCDELGDSTPTPKEIPKERIAGDPVKLWCQKWRPIK